MITVTYLDGTTSEGNSFSHFENWDPIIEINCEDSQLAELPQMPPNLRRLQCKYNQLTNLPKLPTTLVMLGCHNNLLVKLPELPSTVQDIMCGANQLYLFPQLPSKFVKFAPCPIGNYLLVKIE